MEVQCGEAARFWLSGQLCNGVGHTSQSQDTQDDSSKDGHLSLMKLRRIPLRGQGLADELSLHIKTLKG